MSKTRYTPSKEFMTILELQDKMGKQVRELLRDDLTPEEREMSNSKSKFLIGFANQMINGANFALNTEKLLAENGDLDKSLLKDFLY